MTLEEMFKEVNKIQSMALSLAIALDGADKYACACAEFYPAAEEIQMQLEDLKLSMRKVIVSGEVEVKG